MKISLWITGFDNLSVKHVLYLNLVSSQVKQIKYINIKPTTTIPLFIHIFHSRWLFEMFTERYRVCLYADNCTCFYIYLLVYLCVHFVRKCFKGRNCGNKSFYIKYFCWNTPCLWTYNHYVHSLWSLAFQNKHSMSLNGVIWQQPPVFPLQNTEQNRHSQLSLVVIKDHPWQPNTCSSFKYIKKTCIHGW